MRENIQRSVTTGAEMGAQRQAYDVIVIGAGWSGLMACKYCVAEGLRTLVLESRDSIGGVWTFTPDGRVGGVMKTTQTTSSRCITEMSDFPMPADYPPFPSHEQIKAYLEAYCVRFSLTEHIRFKQCVTRVEKRSDLWQVTTSDGNRWLGRHVIVSSGLHQQPNDVSGDERFQGYSGALMHSAPIKEITPEWSGKTIVVWGGGETASDIAWETSKVGARVYFCIPNGVWFVPKRLYGLPLFQTSEPLLHNSEPNGSEPKVTDLVSSRLRLWLSPTHQYSPFVYEYLEWAFGFNGHGQEAWRTAAAYQRSFLNKSTDVLSRVKSGHVVPKRDIASCHGRTVHFTDGTSAEVDAIITCSGYTTVYPFLDESVPAGTDPRKWFKYIFYNEDPSLAFVGFARPVVGSIPGLAELQSRYVARVFAGACRLPEPAERSAITERDARFWNNHFRDTSLRIAGLVDHVLYSDQLARLIGCRPNFVKLFFSSPRRWWQAITAPWNGSQFWLNDARHHDRIFATFRRYHRDRVTQVWIFLLLAPLLPLIALRRRLKIFLGEHLSRQTRTRRAERQPVDSEGTSRRGPRTLIDYTRGSSGSTMTSATARNAVSHDIVPASHRRPRLGELTGRRRTRTGLGLLLGHLAFAASWFVVTPDLLGSLLVWFVLQVGVWAGYHRYFTHRSYKTHPWFEFVLAVVGCLAGQGGLFWWVSVHRHHHRTADTEADVHSPYHGFWRSYMGWVLQDDLDDRIKVNISPDLCRPHLLWVERHDLGIRLAYAASLALLFGWSGILNYYIVPMVLCWHTSMGTNFFAHAMGSHTEECPPRGSCMARNNALVALIDLGEGWHNNHHAHPTYAHHGFYRWYQVDIVYLVLLVLEKLGIIWDVKRRPKRQERRQSEPISLAAA